MRWRRRRRGRRRSRLGLAGEKDGGARRRGSLSQDGAPDGRRAGALRRGERARLGRDRRRSRRGHGRRAGRHPAAAKRGGASVQQLSAKLAVREAEFGFADGATHIVAVVDTAQALLGLGSYRGSSRRLAGVAWSAASLRTDIGAETERDPSGPSCRRLSPGAGSHPSGRGGRGRGGD